VKKGERKGGRTKEIQRRRAENGGVEVREGEEEEKTKRGKRKRGTDITNGRPRWKVIEELGDLWPCFVPTEEKGNTKQGERYL